MDVAAAEPAGRVPHQYLVRFGLVDVDVDHLVATGALEEYGCPGFHDVAPFGGIAAETNET
jgi:hypothetical protein